VIKIDSNVTTIVCPILTKEDHFKKDIKDLEEDICDRIRKCLERNNAICLDDKEDRQRIYKALRKIIKSQLLKGVIKYVENNRWAKFS